MSGGVETDEEGESENSYENEVGFGEFHKSFLGNLFIYISELE